MANLNTAPAELAEKALAARNEAKALLVKHKIGYTKAYSSYCVRTGKVRMKLYGLFSIAGLTPAVTKKLNKLGFEVANRAYFGMGGVNVIGYF